MELGRARFLLLHLIFCAGIHCASAEPLDPLCTTYNPLFVSRSEMPAINQYFSRAFPISKRVSVSVRDWAGHRGEQNFSYDLTTGDAIEAPGTVDGFVSPDETLFSYPKKMRVHFYRMKNGRIEKKILIDKKMQGTYQSMGERMAPETGKKQYVVAIESRTRTSPEPNSSTYDLDATVLSFRVYDEKGEKLVPRAVRALCGNVAAPLRMPMISKTGNKVSVYNASTGTTQVYHVDPDTGQCTLQKDLGISTGKTDFSYDDNKVAFHQYGVKDSAHWLYVPSPFTVSNAYVYDLEKDEIQAITNYTDRNALYPNFLKNGEILVRTNVPEETEPDPKGAPGYGLTLFETYDPSRAHRSIPAGLVRSTSLDVQACGTPKEDATKDLLPIADYFYRLCLGKDPETRLRSLTGFLSLNRSGCEQVIHRYLSEHPSEMSKRDALLKQCPSPSETPHPDSQVKLQKLDTSKLDKKFPNEKIDSLLRDRCLKCHDGALTAQGPAIPFYSYGRLQQELTLDMKEHLVQRVESRTMPPFPEVPLTNEEYAWLLSAFKSATPSK